MGAIKTSELANGNVGLEITYGGREAPFGGVDSSAPPAYIDPKCFVSCDGFIVVDNKLVAASLNPVAVPTLWNGTAGVTLIGFGNFYNPTYGTLNYALGYKAVAVSGSPTGVAYTFYMTSWSPSSITTLWNDTLNYTLYNSATPATEASISLQLQTTSGGLPGSGATVSITAISNLGSNSEDPNSGANIFYLAGIVQSVAISGGSGYQVGTSYWIQQGTNVTAAINITAVNGIGAITGFTIVPDSYSTTYNTTGYVNTPVSCAGWGYSVGAATLVYAESSNVVLQINGPGGMAEYTVLNNGVAEVTPTLPGSGAVLYIGSIIQNGVYYSYAGSHYHPPNSGSVYAVGVPIGEPGDVGGSNYSVGQVYYLDEVVGNGPTDITNPPTYVSGTGTAQVIITAVGAGGTITEVALFDSGAPDAGYSFVHNSVSGMCLITRPVPIQTVTGSVASILTEMAANINASDANVTAVANIGGSALVLTALPAWIGTIGNTITVQDFSQITGPEPFYYYFPCRNATNLTGGSSGTNSGTVLSTILPAQASIASVGGTLYIGNIGPAIIKYGGPGAFVTSTTLQGVRVLRKYAGSLIGLGLIPAPGTVVSSVDMIFAWSAPSNLDIWAPTDVSGNVTGAGFAKLADIGDYLTGLIVTSGTAFIIRSQGVSYATATGNATSPFNFAHIGLGDEGEGGQLTALVTQYDQAGAFVGNSDIYQVGNGIASIGAKIKTALFSSILGNTYKLNASISCASYLSDDMPLFTFVVGNVLYVYNSTNGTWQTMTLSVDAAGIDSILGGVFASANTSATSNLFNQCSPVVAVELNGTYAFYSLVEGVPNTFAMSNPPTVSFPVEEVAFGRDITIDAMYVALNANVSEDTMVNFYINGTLFTSLVLPASEFNSLSGTPVELQVFSSSNSTSGAVTTHSPQLSYEIVPFVDTATAQVRFTKIALFASYDPMQRPV